MRMMVGAATVLVAIGVACSADGERIDVTREAPTTADGSGDAGDASASGTAAAGGPVDDEGAIGTAGDGLLSASTPRVVVEVDRSPAASVAIDPRAVVAEELREHGGKQSVRAAGDSRVPGQDVYTARDLRSITAAARSVRSTGDEAAVYVLVLEGRYENERVTGVAFQATSFAIFPDQIGGALLGLQREAFERAVTVHELGHLFGLVNLTGHGAFHEDPEHPGHAESEDSVMYWAVEDISIANLFRGGPPTEFDAADREEMARIRAG